MGFFSSFCSGVSSVLSTVGGALSAVGNTFISGVSGICSKIGGAFFSGAGGIAALATSMLGVVLRQPDILVIIEAIRCIGAIVSAIAETLGLKDAQESPEELGMKAENAEKKPEDFDSISEYIEYLREDIELDKGRVESLSEEDRAKYEAKYAAIGSGIYIKGIEEQYGIEAPGEFWRTVADLKMKGEEVREYIETFKINGIGNMKDMSDYIRGISPESGTEPKIVSNAIIDTLKKVYPEMSQEELYEKFNSMTISE